MNEPVLPSAQAKLLAALSPELRALAERGVIRSFRKNATLITEGEMGDSLFVLLQGRVKVYAIEVDGREITYNVVEAGDYFAEMCLDGGPRSASVMALEPCVCAVVSRPAVREHLLQHPGFAFDLVVQVIRRARTATATARNLALLDVYGRLVKTLEGERGPAADAPVLLEGLTHQHIASRVGASREMVSRLLKDLEKGGYIALGIKQITLKKKLPARW